VGHARPIRVALLMAAGRRRTVGGLQYRVSLAQPIADCGRAGGASQFIQHHQPDLCIMLAAARCPTSHSVFFFAAERQSEEVQAAGRIAALWLLGGDGPCLWGGSIFVYGAAVPRLGSLGTFHRWPLSLAVGLLLAMELESGWANGGRLRRRRANGWFPGSQSFW